MNKIELSAEALWTEFQRGEGELEIGNQGRSQNSTKSFSQETGAIGQTTPRIGEIRPKRREYSAGRANNSDSTPHLFFHQEILGEKISEYKNLLEMFHHLRNS